MEDEISKDFLKEIVEKQNEENYFFKNKRLTNMVDIFLVVFVIAIICISFVPF